ncbi:MAG: coproporphyrinogen III oxidase family protein [Silvanigrellaceae bacterium]|nr:coproporphyrinogen III oxidase family protein [Silvanigrellaceae bacterium]
MMKSEIANWNNISGIDKVGFYIHIPFCPHICPYCDFVKTSKFSKSDVKFYLQSCKEQLDTLLNLIPEQIRSATLYFGGGTPGILSSDCFAVFIDHLKKKFALEEITLETNPFTNNQKRLQEYASVGIDRITLGAQSLCPETLKFLGRKHTTKDVFQTIAWAQEAGIETIQVDLIYGLGKQIRTISLEDEIKSLSNAKVTGISAYALTIEERTLFAKKSSIVSDEAAENDYECLVKTCKSVGFTQIETSNFSYRPARHNHIYWLGYPYLGIGTGAHGLLFPTVDHPYGQRYKVGQTPKELSPGNDLLSFTAHDELTKNFTLQFEPPRTKKQYVEEMIFTLLRTPLGISRSWLNEVTNSDALFDKILSNAKVQRGIQEQKICLTNDRLTISPLEKIRGDAWAADIIFMISP